MGTEGWRPTAAVMPGQRVLPGLEPAPVPPSIPDLPPVPVSEPEPPEPPEQAGEERPDPNRNDYARVVADPGDPEKFIWRVYAGNHHITHRSKRNYTRESNALRALEREHPGVEIRD